MVFIILGTQDKAFPRLLAEIEKQIKIGNIKGKVIVQAGYTKYKSDKTEIHDILSMDEFNNYIKKSDYIITHAGVGSILDSIRASKKIIAVPRLSKYKEHVNDHQIQIATEFEKLGYIIKSDVSDLGSNIKKLNTFHPQKFKSNNNNFIKTISDYIDNL